MASPGNQHCADYIGTLSFPIVRCGGARRRTDGCPDSGLADDDVASLFVGALTNGVIGALCTGSNPALSHGVLDN